MARQSPEDPEKQQIVRKDGNRQANQAPCGFQPFYIIEIQRGDNHLLCRSGDGGNRQRDNQRDQQANQRDQIAEVFYPDFFLILRRTFPHVARLGANRFTQVAHPVNTGVERDQQADQPDGGTLLYGGVDGVFKRCRQRRVADVLQDFIEDVLQQGRMPGQHETSGGE